jgi:copper chaperone CopZ
MMAFFGLASHAQVQKVSLQASGLTCSMCSKAVYNALTKVSFVNKVDVDIKDQRYDISFKEGANVDFDALSKAVSDAGFSVAKFVVTAYLDKLVLQKDKHVQIAGKYFLFLNADGQQINGTTSFTLVDKSLTSTKNFKKYSGMTKMECMQTGYSSGCCDKEIPGHTRIYHAII